MDCVQSRWKIVIVTGGHFDTHAGYLVIPDYIHYDVHNLASQATVDPTVHHCQAPEQGATAPSSVKSLTDANAEQSKDSVTARRGRPSIVMPVLSWICDQGNSIQIGLDPAYQLAGETG